MRSVFALLILWGSSVAAIPAGAQTAALPAGSQTPTTTDSTLRALPSRYLGSVQARSQKIDQAITLQSTTYLNRLSRLEARILGRLQKTDSAAGSRLSPASYQQLAAQMQSPASGANHYATSYVPGLDTLGTTLKFLQTKASQTGANAGSVQGQVAAKAGLVTTQLNAASAQVQQLQGKLNEANLVQQYISRRQQELAQLLGRYTHLPPGVLQTFTQFKTTGYYYRQQIQQYKNMLNDPGKVERLVVSHLSQVPAYTQFMARYSILASLFKVPTGYGDGTAKTQGLQTQSELQQTLQAQLGNGGGSAQVQQQLQSAQGKIQQIQNSLSKYGVGAQGIDMPNFQPNSQKTKTFLKRIEYGVNVQFAKSSYDFPTTGDLGLSLGYKLNDKSTVGVGLAYNIGLGSGWNFIQFTNQGLGLRSYMDWKIKKTYYVTGGYELNYLTQFASIDQLRNRSAWQPSALIGLEKKYKISSKLQGNLQLLFDALYRQEIPQGQAIRFRVGYNF